jgi:hypothetical protein
LISGEFQNPKRRFGFKEGAAMTYPYRSILTPIQFDDPKQILVMHSAMLPVLTLSPLAQKKAAHLRLLESAGA